jgi:predicted alpha/beta superfamily hydrolase
MVGTLVPRVVREYGVMAGPLGGVVAGSSMGGLAALYAHFRHPDVFGGALSMSPAYWFGRGALYDWIRGRPTPHFSRVYIDCGAREGGGRMAQGASAMADHLRQRGYGEDRLLLRIDKRGTHNEKHWRRRLPRALRFMFKK